MRLGQAIARKYGLTHLVMFVFDVESRSRIITYGRGFPAGVMNSAQAAAFGGKLAAQLGWPESACTIDTSFVKGLKQRIKELETALAQIADGMRDPVGLARAAGKFPNESDEEDLGAWLYFRSGKCNKKAIAEQSA